VRRGAVGVFFEKIKPYTSTRRAKVTRCTTKRGKPNIENMSRSGSGKF
jgi:hypothetical protein